MTKLSFVFAFIFLLAGCSGTSASNTPELIPSPVAATEETQTATPVTLISTLVPSSTYVDPKLGYAFDYPVDWTINDLPDVPYSAVTIHSWDPVNLTGLRSQGQGIPEGGEKMDILPQRDYGADFEQALPWFREGNVGQEFTEEEVVLPTGVHGIMIRFEPVSGEPNVRCLLTAVNETTILVCGAGWDLQFFEAIAFSLREAE